MERKTLMKILSWLLVSTLIICQVPVSAFAEEDLFLVDSIAAESAVGIQTPSNFVRSDDFLQVVINTKGSLVPETQGKQEYVDAEIAVFDPKAETFIDKSSQIAICDGVLSGKEKKSYSIEFSTEAQIGTIGTSRYWTAFGNRFDNTLLRNYLAMNLASKLGVEYATGCDFAELWLDGCFIGCYLISVNYPNANAMKDIDSDMGDFIIESSIRTEENGRYVITQDGKKFRITEPEYPTEAQELWIKNRIDHVSSALGSGSFSELVKYVDIESFAKLYLINEFLLPEGVDQIETYYYYKNNKLYAGLLWNYELSSGNYGIDTETKEAKEEKTEKTCASNWYLDLLKYPAFLNLVCNIFTENEDFIQGCGIKDGFLDSAVQKYSELFQKNFTSTEKNGAGWRVSDLHVSAEHPLATERHPDSDVIIVDASGNGDYESFTEAIYDNYSNAKNVIVREGIYDIRSEYEELFGKSVVDSLSDSDELGYSFQFGVRISGRTVVFEDGSQLICDWTGHVVDGIHRFSPIAIGSNVVIDGMNLDCTNTFYCIHDDYGFWGNFYSVLYRNCNIVGHNIAWGNCIGGGCKKKSLHIIENCTFDNGWPESSITVRYHNTFEDNAEPILYFADSAFNGVLSFNWYGNQTTKMKAFVTNCTAEEIGKRAEIPGETNDNIELEIQTLNTNEIYRQNLTSLKKWLNGRLSWLYDYWNVASVKTDVTDYCKVLTQAYALSPGEYVNYSVLQTALKENQIDGTESQSQIDKAVQKIENAIQLLQKDESRQVQNESIAITGSVDGENSAVITISEEAEQYKGDVPEDKKVHVIAAKTEQTWGGKGKTYIEAQFSTDGMENAEFHASLGASDDGPRDFCLSCSFDGESFFRINGSERHLSESRNLQKIYQNFKLPDKCNNKDSIYLRIEVDSDTKMNGKSGLCGSGSGELAFHNLTVSGSIAEELKILQQPTDQSGRFGEKVQFIYQVDGNDLEYQWYEKAKTDTVWECSGDTGNQTNTLVVEVDNQNDKKEYRCLVQNADQKHSVSDRAVLSKVSVFYTVTWKNENGDVLAVDSIELGMQPEFKGATPEKKDTPEWRYLFIGWNPEISSNTIVKGDIEYTAQYEAIIRTYNIIWLDENGSVIDTVEEEYGSFPTHSIPESLSGGIFVGWEPAVTTVTKPATYRAVFKPHPDGINEENGELKYYLNNKLQTQVDGFVSIGGTTYRIRKGIVVKNASGLISDPSTGEVYYCKGGIVQTDYSGLYRSNYTLVYLKNGKFDREMCGFVSYNGTTYFISKGVVSSDTNGLVKDPNTGEWCYCASGIVQSRYTGLCQFDGAWFYVQKGRLFTGKSGFVTYNGSLFYVGAGQVMTEVNGLAQDPNTGKWYYCARGCAQTQYTGLCQYNGAWFYIDNGVLDTGKAGFVSYYGGRFYVGAGQVMMNISGLAQDPKTGNWYYLANGQIQEQYTGLCQYNGSWFYVEAGRFATEFIGRVEYNGSWFSVIYGEVK